MWYDLRCGDDVIERLGLDELKQELTNCLEGGRTDLVIALHGELPVAKSKRLRKVGKAAK